jgi:TetR/AcrR family transcriptional regulator, transcriptional repressor for nem operon
MRYEKGHREATRQHILQVASRRFRRDGVAAAGLAGIMKEAGLTNGAFYNHFESKDDLVRETMVLALDQRRDRLVSTPKGLDWIETMVRGYLSASHRDNPATGCLESSLGGEIARMPRKTRTVFTDKAAQFVDLIAENLVDHEPAQRRKKAIAIYATLIGTLQLSRCVTDKALSDEFLQTGIDAVMRLVAGGSEETCATP